MTFRRSIQGLVLVVLGAAAGCTVKNSNSDGGSSTCSTDSTVMCPQGQGWSCTGSDSPADHNALVCSTPTVTSSNKPEYCCIASTVASNCTEDSTVTATCTKGTGFSCAPAADGGEMSPQDSDPSLTCSSGTAGNNGQTLFCCY
jgi:hypothetical protein